MPVSPPSPLSTVPATCTAHGAAPLGPFVSGHWAPTSHRDSPGFTCGSLGYGESQPAVGLPPVRGVPTRRVLRPHRHARGALTVRPASPLRDFPLARASLRALPLCTRRDACDVRQGAVPRPPCRALRLPNARGDPGPPERPWPPAWRCGGPAAAAPLGDSLRGRSASAREARGPLPRRMTPAAGGCPRERLRPAPPRAGVLPAHETLQGHAAHLGERPTPLSPNGAWGAWTPTWASRVASCIHAKIALHGALQWVIVPSVSAHYVR